MSEKPTLSVGTRVKRSTKAMDRVRRVLGEDDPAVEGYANDVGTVVRAHWGYSEYQFVRVEWDRFPTVEHPIRADFLEVWSE